MEYKVSILCMMNLTSGKQNIEFHLLMAGLGAAEAYKYKILVWVYLRACIMICPW